MSSRPRYTREDFEDGPSPWKIVGGTLLVLTLAGVFYGTIFGGFREYFTYGGVHDWQWWHYALGLPVLGLLGLAVHGLGEGAIYLVTWPLRWRQDENAWKRYAFWLYCLALAAAIAFWIYWLLVINVR